MLTDLVIDEEVFIIEFSQRSRFDAFWKKPVVVMPRRRIQRPTPHLLGCHSAYPEYGIRDLKFMQCHRSGLGDWVTPLNVGRCGRSDTPTVLYCNTTSSHLLSHDITGLHVGFYS